MIRPIAVLRPEPGNAATCARIAAAGHLPIALPLFEVVALPWTAPDACDFDALLLTSANAVRMAGPALRRFAALPAYAVGRATAEAARAAGLTVAATGAGDAATLLAAAGAEGVMRALHLGGRETMVAPAPPVARAITVYASDSLPVAAEQIAALDGAVALVHSARAAARLAELAGAVRPGIALVAISPAAAMAAGEGWRSVSVAQRPDDAAMLAAAFALAAAD